MSGRLSRRQFLKVSGATAVSVGAVTTGIKPAAAATGEVGRATLPYKAQVIAHARQMKVNVPVPFNYPDASSPCLLLKMGRPTLGGVGPHRDIVAYSTLCTHMGCPVNYEEATGRFKCPCHFSMFDPEKGGQMISGQASEDLPQIILHYNPSDDTVTATGVHGLIYGRQSNVL